MKEKGSISIHTENIFPIIKKFLYLCIFFNSFIFSFFYLKVVPYLFNVQVIILFSHLIFVHYITFDSFHL